MSILKLKEAGEKATLTITGCAVVEGQYGEQIEFDAGEDRLYLPKSSADRQLERLGLEYDQVVGQTLEFSRTPGNKPGVVFWNINTVKKNGAVKPTATPEKPRLTASVPDSALPPELRNTEQEEKAELAQKIGADVSKIEGTLSLYQSIAEWGARELPKIFTTGKDAVGMTPESLAACVNTIFINTAGKK